MSDLLPPNATDQERALSNATARMGDIDVPIDTLWDPESCPVSTLPWLAWALSVDVWDTTWSEAQKRATIAAAVQVHRIKGTRGAVVKAIDALGYDVAVVEWFEEGEDGDPFTFRLDVSVDSQGVDEALYSSLEKVAARTKNTRSHLSGISVSSLVSGSTHFASVPMLGDALTVLPWAATEIANESGPVYLGAGLAVYDILTVSPSE